MRIALAGLLVLGLAATANANGREPGTSTINFQRGNDQHIVAGMTFGVIASKDGGATWQWMCERAVGYGGQYDPDYVYSSTGAVFATTFDGLKVMRDGCSFNATPPGMTFVSRVEGGPDGAIYYAAADMNDAKVYKSPDDGMTFPTAAAPGLAGDWWSSLAVAPSNAQRLYLTGYRFVKKCNPSSSNPGTACTMDAECPGGACEPEKVYLLFTSANGGTSYTPLSLTGITPLSANSTIEVVGISPTNDQTLYVKVTFETNTAGDSIYRSTNAGQSWTKILSRTSNLGTLSFLVRNDGSCVAGTRDVGSWKATNCSTVTPSTWTALTNAPHIGCLYKDTSDTVWACTQNYTTPMVPGDGFGIMKTTDLTNWTGVLKFQDIQAPVSCPAGTVQEDQCVQRYMDQQSQWCCLVPQLGITSTAIDCTGALSCFGNPIVDGAPDAGTTIKPPTEPKTCCGTADPRSSGLLFLIVAALLLSRRRRPKEG